MLPEALDTINSKKWHTFQIWEIVALLILNAPFRNKIFIFNGTAINYVYEHPTPSFPPKKSH